MSAAEAGDRTYAPLSAARLSDRSPSLLSLRHTHSFMSLFQKGPNGEERTAVELTVFKKSLSNMMEWYAHPHVFTFKLTRLPKGYPTGFKFPPGVEPNLADYEDRCANDACSLTLRPTHTQDAVSVLCRGWCFCESSVSNLIKDFDMVLDLGKFDEESMKDWGATIRGCIANRDPPLTPPSSGRSSPQSRLRARTRTRRW